MLRRKKRLWSVKFWLRILNVRLRQREVLVKSTHALRMSPAWRPCWRCLQTGSSEASGVEVRIRKSESWSLPWPPLSRHNTDLPTHICISDHAGSGGSHLYESPPGVGAVPRDDVVLERSWLHPTFWETSDQSHGDDRHFVLATLTQKHQTEKQKLRSDLPEATMYASPIVSTCVKRDKNCSDLLCFTL